MKNFYKITWTDARGKCCYAALDKETAIKIQDRLKKNGYESIISIDDGNGISVGETYSDDLRGFIEKYGSQGFVEDMKPPEGVKYYGGGFQAGKTYHEHLEKFFELRDHDDQLDALAYALEYLTQPKIPWYVKLWRWTKRLFKHKVN